MKHLLTFLALLVLWVGQAAAQPCPPVGGSPCTTNWVVNNLLTVNGSITGPIGNITPSTGAFTTLGATGTSTLANGALTASNSAGAVTLAATGINSQVQFASHYAGLQGTFTYSGSQATIGTQYGFLESLSLAGSVSSGTINANKVVINSDTAATQHGSQGVSWWNIGGSFGLGTSWAQNTVYTSGTRLANLGNVYQETVASCTSLNTGTGPSGTGSGISDNTCSWNYVSANGAGSRAALNVGINVPSQIGLPSGGDDSDRQWQALIQTMSVSHNQGGTAPINGQSAGFFYAGGDQMWCFAGATDLSGCVGRETDVGIYTGASASSRFGQNVVSFGNLNAHDFDIGYRLGTFGTAPGFLIGWGPAGGVNFAVASTGALFQYSPPYPGSLAAISLTAGNPQVTFGWDLSGIECSTACWRQTGGTLIDGAGALSAQSLKISTSGAIVTVDVPGAELASAALAVGGSGYVATDHLYEPTTGTILTPSGLSGGVVTGYTIVTKGHYTGSPPSNPVTLLGGTGAGATTNLSWTAATTVALGAGTTSVAVAASGGKVGFYAATPIVKATPTGACAGNTGCQALRDAMGNLGLINTGSITN